MEQTVKLTPEAQAKLATLSVVLADLGLTPTQALALFLAEDVANQVNEEHDEGADLLEEASFTLETWGEDSHAAWGDVLCEVSPFLTVG